jgi:hypothetical protein
MSTELGRDMYCRDDRRSATGSWLRAKARRKADAWMAHECEGLDREQWIPLRRELSHITRAIEASRDLLATYDENDQPVCSRDTWERAVRFLSAYARRLWEKFGVKVGAPQILPGGEGSIDILWSEPQYELLLNIPADQASPATYYGDDRVGNSVKGTVASIENRGLVLWLAMRK